MAQSENLRQNKAYRLALWSLGGVAFGVLVGVIGIIVEAITGDAILFWLAFAMMTACVFVGWSALFMLIRWAREQQRSTGTTTLDALMQMRRQLDVDVRRLLRRG